MVAPPPATSTRRPKTACPEGDRQAASAWQSQSNRKKMTRCLSDRAKSREEAPERRSPNFASLDRRGNASKIEKALWHHLTNAADNDILHHRSSLAGEGYYASVPSPAAGRHGNLEVHYLR